MAETVRAQLELLYRAGKQTFPARANALAGALETIGEVHSAWRTPTIRAGEPDALLKALEINQEVYQLLRRAVLTWQDASFALVAIARDFEETDERAADAAQQLSFTLDTDLALHLEKPPTLKDVSE